MRTHYKYIFILSCLFAFPQCKGQTTNKDTIVNRLNFSAAVLIARDGSNKDSLLAAVYLLDSAIKLDQGNYHSYQNKCTAECQLGKYQDAISDIDRILKIKSNYAEIKTEKGFILEKLNRKDEATKSYKDAVIDYKARLKKDPTNINSLVDLALLTIF